MTSSSAAHRRDEGNLGDVAVGAVPIDEVAVDSNAQSILAQR
jgi:hypothetical protein